MDRAMMSGAIAAVPSAAAAAGARAHAPATPARAASAPWMTGSSTSLRIVGGG